MSLRGLLVQFGTGDEPSQDGGRMVDTWVQVQGSHALLVVGP